MKLFFSIDEEKKSMIIRSIKDFQNIMKKSTGKDKDIDLSIKNRSYEAICNPTF